MTIFAKVREEALPEMQNIYEQLSRAVAEQSVTIENLHRKWPTNKAFGYERLMPAIMYAAEKDDLPLVKALVESGVPVDDTHYYLSDSFDASDQPNGSPLSHARSVEMARFLVQNGADPDFQDGAPLKNAIRQNNVALFEFLMESGSNLKKWSVELMKIASETGSLPIVRHLVSVRADVNATLTAWERTPLMNAAANGDEALTRYLLEHGAEVNIRNRERVTPLILAVVGGSAPCVSLLLEHGADANDVDADEVSVLSLALDGENLAMVENLHRHGARLSPRNKERMEALSFWANPQILQITRILQQHQLVDAGQPTADQKQQIRQLADAGIGADLLENPATILLFFYLEKLYSRKDKTIAQLEAYRVLGADVNAKTESGMTPLMFAARAVYSIGNLDAAMRYLIDHGASVNATAKNGSTALILAAAHGNAEAIPVLMEHGADINTRTKNGTTALAEAIMGMPAARYPARFLATARSLLESGADESALVQLLQHPQYDVRLTAIQAAGDLGLRSAIPHLIQRMSSDPERHRLAFFLAKALKEISGQNFGNDALAWERWWKKQLP